MIIWLNMVIAAEPEGSSIQKDNTISLLDLLAVLVKHRWFIVISTILAGILIVLYSAYTLRAPPNARFNFMPNLYKPEVRVRLQDQDNNSVSNILSGSNLGILATIAGGISAAPSSAELAQELLVGNSLIDQLVDEFDIIEQFGIVQNPRSSARKLLRGSFETDFVPATSIIIIRFESTDKIFATEILNSAIIKLERRFKDLTMKNVSVKKDFLESSIAKYEAELRAAQQTLIDFKVDNNVIDIVIQAEHQLNALANLETQILEKETTLSSILEYRREDDPEVRRLQMDLELLRARWEAIKWGFKDDIKGLDIPQEKLPALSAQLLNLTRDLTIIETIYSSLRSQYETVKLEEQDNSDRFQVIEQAEIPEIKAGPSRSKICMVVTAAVLFLAVFFSFVMEYFERIRSDPVESVKLQNIRRMLWKPRKK